MVRVTSGSLKGFKLDVPKLDVVRPPLEIVREAVFNILGQNLEGWRVVDVFAGSGIMGIEALSRGAEVAIFVEKSRAAAAVIEKNLAKTRMTDRAKVITGNAFSLPLHIEGAGPIDAIFLDPPFEMLRNAPTRDRVLELISAAAASPDFAPDGLIVLRVPEKVYLDELPEGVALADERRYGHSRVLFYERPAPEGETEETPETSDSPVPPAPEETET